MKQYVNDHLNEGYSKITIKNYLPNKTQNGDEFFQNTYLSHDLTRASLSKFVHCLSSSPKPLGTIHHLVKGEVSFQGSMIKKEFLKKRSVVTKIFLRSK